MMGLVIGSCNDCGIHLSLDELYLDCDNIYRCQKCKLKHELAQVQTDQGIEKGGCDE